MPRKKDKINKLTQLVPHKQEDPNVKPELMGSFGSYDIPLRVLPKYGYGLYNVFLKYPELYGTGLPFQYGYGTGSTGFRGFVSLTDAILLCQKAYCRVGMYKNSVDLLQEMSSNSDIYLDEGTDESISFFEAWLKRINIQKLKDQFFKELFLSGNIFLFRVDGKMSQEGAKKIKQMYAKAQQVDLPLRYIMLNPANIAIYGGLNFEAPLYFRILTKFEIDIMKKSGNELDKEIYKNLPDAIKGYFNTGSMRPVSIPADKLHTIFYKKMDYEPFAVPMAYPLLDSLELKLALQKADSILARSVEYAILLITMGAKKEDGGTNPISLQYLKDAFKSEQIGRVLVSDYTTKAQFVVPDLLKILGEDKYKAVNRDISEGMMNIFFEQDASRQMVLTIKIKAFAEKITAAQNLFINEFLAPEIKRISKLMGFKSYPKPSFNKIHLDDPSQMLRIYTQLLQLGVLTPKDGLQAIERGILPVYDDLHDHQEVFKKDKDQGLFQPVTGAPYTQLQIAKLNAKTQLGVMDKQQEHQINQTKLTQQHDLKKTKMQQDHDVANPKPPTPNLQIVTKPIANPPNAPKGKNPSGRPSGTKGSISMSKLIENIKLHSQLTDEVNKEYKETNNKKKLSKADKDSIKTIINGIMQFEEPKNWVDSVGKFIKNPQVPSEEKLLNIVELSEQYNVSEEVAIIVSHSINNEE